MKRIALFVILAASFAQGQTGLQKQALARPDLVAPPKAAGSPSSQPMQPGQGSTLGAAANYFTDSSKVSPENATVVPGDEGGEELAGSGNPLIDHAQSVVTGFDKGAADIAHSLGRVANAATGNNISALPTSFTEPDYLKSDNGADNSGAETPDGERRLR